MVPHLILCKSADHKRRKAEDEGFSGNSCALEPRKNRQRKFRQTSAVSQKGAKHLFGKFDFMTPRKAISHFVDNKSTGGFTPETAASVVNCLLLILWKMLEYLWKIHHRLCVSLDYFYHNAACFHRLFDGGMIKNYSFVNVTTSKSQLQDIGSLLINQSTRISTYIKIATCVCMYVSVCECMIQA